MLGPLALEGHEKQGGGVGVGGGKLRPQVQAGSVVLGTAQCQHREQLLQGRGGERREEMERGRGREIEERGRQREQKKADEKH